MVEITDLRAPKSGPLDGIFRPMLRAERDVSLARTIFYLFPLGLVLIGLNFAMFSWWTVALYWAFYLWYMGPCTLMMHNVVHGRVFKNKRVDSAAVAAVGVVFGHAPGTYPGHHLAMHHREGNGPKDASSTLRFQRDSFIDFFFGYFGRFIVIGMWDLVGYLSSTKREKVLRDVIIGELAWYALCIGLAFVHLEAALACFIIPTITTRFLLMAGNWAQHAFIDPVEWDNDYKSVTTFINSPYNHRCFNDGYHLNHHLRAGAHWTEMPARFEAILDEVIAQKSLVFTKIDYFMIWSLLMMKQHRTLAKFVVDFGEPTTIEERVELLKSRLQPIDVSSPAAESVEGAMAA